MQASVEAFDLPRPLRRPLRGAIPEAAGMSVPAYSSGLADAIDLGLNESTSATTVALSAVVPCFNEEAGLLELYPRLSRACRDAVGDDYEIVLVDDGSTDGTWAGIRKLTERDPHIVGVMLSRNHGHQLALTAGLSVCRGERVLILDADLQDPPELVGEMLALIDREGADVVYGQRLSREGETWHKKATASLFYRLLGKLT